MKHWIPGTPIGDFLEVLEASLFRFLRTDFGEHYFHALECVESADYSCSFRSSNHSASSFPSISRTLVLLAISRADFVKVLVVMIQPSSAW